MTDLLADNPVLLLFVVAGLGYVLGRVEIGGFGLGIAAVLFAGIAVGAIDERLQLPSAIWTLGLVVFVYTVGLAAGPGFVAALRRRGLSANVLAVVILGVVTLVALATRVLDAVNAPTAAGMFAGGLTNTPALAGALEQLQTTLSADEFDRVATDPVVGYSLAYPAGVIVPLVAAWWVLRRPAGPRDDTTAVPSGSAEPIIALTVRVSSAGLPPIGELRDTVRRNVQFTRVARDGEVRVATRDVRLAPGDLVTIVGAEEDARHVADWLGQRSDRALELDRAVFDFRRMFVSSVDIAGRTVGELELPERFGAIVTRVRRGDVDMLSDDALVLELGDRVRVVAPRERMPELSALFGDSYRSLAEIDVMTFSVGIALGLLLGALDIPVPGLGTFELGNAAGPLLVGLVLGAIGRTGPLLWQIPYAANLTLRQLGLVLFLAGVGTRSGQAFASTITDRAALSIAGGAFVITAIATLLFVVLARRLLRIEGPRLAGMLAGFQTQPAVLAFVSQRVLDDSEVNRAYATVFPVAMIAKIVLAHVIAASAT